MKRARQLAQRRQALLLRGDALRLRLSAASTGIAGALRAPIGAAGLVGAVASSAAGRLMPLLSIALTVMRVVRAFRRR